MSIKFITSIIITLILAGCASGYKEISSKEGTIPLYRQKELQDIHCYIQARDSVYILKSNDSSSFAYKKNKKYESRQRCQGWISNTMLDSLTIFHTKYEITDTLRLTK